MLRLTKDSDLPVRLKAANALRFLCQNELAVEPLKSVLPHLLESTSIDFYVRLSCFFMSDRSYSFSSFTDHLQSSVYFGLMAEIDNDDLVKSLEIIIQCFSKEIVPFALGLTQKLVEV